MRTTGILVAVAVTMAGVATPAAADPVCPRTIRIDPAPSVREGNPLVFTATLITPPGCPTVGTVTFRTQAPVAGGGFDAIPGSGPASPKADYIARTGLLEWKPGDQPTKEIPVQTLVDSLYEVPEEVAVCLERPSSEVEVPSPCTRSEISSPMCLQADMTVPITIGLSVPARDDVSVFYDTIDGTAKEGQDYVGVHNGQVRIPAGRLDTVAPIRILPNQPGEGFEFFFAEFRSTHDGYTERSRVKIDIMTR
ncbi:hypothetical protein JOF56_007067 [Kibdelosporangium banguiense]|uniref:Calx-beta domain-containing protein n=1 Tax=Kibdelosporangium banguiense TaxID=1365924 RepID=A0ABS4TQJ3_9PSEU|nr:Calx-beta domain-containing protein [Kibdelosporangium banguiense]MBP2326682.1 hypothetical protein [Kibdelosporangium banguiense]